jgi:S-adenosylmethionine:tRNA ribosyltransferase-isomerase
MRLDELDYSLPAELIAQVPVEPRDAARLLVVRGAGAGLSCDDRSFRELPDLLRPGDVLVRNDTRVIPARARFCRPTGGRVELLFLERLADAASGPASSAGEIWEALARGRLRGGEILRSEAAPAELAVEVEAPLGEGRYRVRSAGVRAEPLVSLLERYGETPLPPYIKTALADPERYQSVFARPRGSAAAPTAGLHFTAALDRALVAAGVTIEHLTLHVGLATFRPVTVERLEDHPLHDEPFVVDRGALRRLASARAEGRRVVAVGTTMVRLLEELGAAGLLAAPAGAASPAGATGTGASRVEAGGRSVAAQPEAPLHGRTRLFITPGHRFVAVDGLITNFHLPRTSLLALVMAFCGVDETRRVYGHAIAGRYRFYSFGDAMLAFHGGVAP